jgi:hypothetical protein
MPLPQALRDIIDEDLDRIRKELRHLAPNARLALAGSLAFDEPWARRGDDGSWVLESDYDLYLVVPSLRESRRLLRDPALQDLGTRLRTRATVDPFVLWTPLLERGWAGMAGRWLDDGRFVDCRLETRPLQVNQIRKALIRLRLLAPRETPERARYQRVKATLEALRALILLHTPELSPRSLFSLRANRRWLRDQPEALTAPHRDALVALLQARLDLEGPGPTDTLLRPLEPWVEEVAQASIQSLQAGARRPSLPSSTTARAWAGLLRHGLLPDPRLDYDAALIALLADPQCARLASDPDERAAFARRWRHLGLPAPLPRHPDRIIRAVDAALGNPTSGKGERYLIPRSAA